MVIVDDRVVLTSWNGRPTVSIDVVEGMPLLHWLLLGHTESFDIWLHATLSWDQADTLCASRPGGYDLGAYVASLDAVPVRYDLNHDGVTMASGETVLPGGPDSAREGMRIFVKTVQSEWDAEGTPVEMRNDLAMLAAAA